MFSNGGPKVFFNFFLHNFVSFTYPIIITGFEFSDAEPSALLQKQGGPCGVIAPVQAFLLKILLMETPGYNISDVSLNFYILSIYLFLDFRKIYINNCFKLNLKYFVYSLHYYFKFN